MIENIFSTHHSSKLLKSPFSTSTLLRLSYDQKIWFYGDVYCSPLRKLMWNVCDVLRRWKKIPQDYFCQTFAPFFCCYFLSFIDSYTWTHRLSHRQNSKIKIQILFASTTFSSLCPFTLSFTICVFYHIFRITRFKVTLLLMDNQLVSLVISLVRILIFKHCTLLTIQLAENFHLLHTNWIFSSPFKFHFSQETRQSCDNSTFSAW